MRIISGTRRGRKLISFEGDSIRPTTDRVKESVFNLIQEYIPGSIVLDLFGGSGSLSLEAVSRGAKKAVIVDCDKKSIEVIRKNIELTSFNNETEVIFKTAQEYIKSSNENFDVIFLDPPYNKGFILPVISSIVSENILAEDGIIMLESDFSDEHGNFDGLEILKQRKYGRTYITVYRKKSK